jgi:hypothetical protein
MGTGCSSNSVGKCPPSDRLSSNCVVWQGDSYPELGICTGDTITEVTEIVLTKIIDFTNGEGITISDLVAGCESIDRKLRDTDYSLAKILEVIVNEQCRIDEVVDSIGTTVDEAGRITIDVSCLTPTPVTSVKDFHQLLVDSICENKSKIDDITSGLPSRPITSIIREEIANFLTSSLLSCNDAIQRSGSGEATTFNIVGAPIGTLHFGMYDLTKFDSTGLGTGIYCNYALANGRNGTVDMRDYVPAMASNISGVARTFSLSTNVGDVAGENTSQLTVSNLPPHNHSINIDQEPHKHELPFSDATPGKGGDAGDTGRRSIKIEPYATYHLETKLSTIDINASTTNTVGATSKTFENRQPTRYGVWIQRIR